MRHKYKKGDPCWVLVDSARLRDGGGFATVISSGRKYITVVTTEMARKFKFDVTTHHSEEWPYATLYPSLQAAKDHHKIKVIRNYIELNIGRVLHRMSDSELTKIVKLIKNKYKEMGG